MIPPIYQSKLKLGQTFWMQWIQANCLGLSTGFTFPILLADLISAQSYANFLQAAALTFGTWVGLAQWIVLRQFFAISAWWVGVVALSPLAAGLLVLPFSPDVRSFYFWTFVVYVSLLSLGQWSILRRALQPAWQWIIANFIAVVLSWDIGLTIVPAIQVKLSHTSFSVALGSLVCGCIYSLLTGLSLCYLHYQHERKLSFIQDHHSDLSRGKVWQAQLISTLILLLMLAGWVLVFPPPLALLSDESGPFNIVLMVICGCIYMYGSIFVHEMGHLLFALANGFEVKALAIGRWVFVPREQGIKLCRTQYQWAAGFVMSWPKSLKFLRARIFLTILGGPLTSLLLACVGFFPFVFLPSDSYPSLAWFVAFCSVYNLHLTIYSVLPLRISSLSTDGRRMLDIAQNNPQGQRFVAVYAYMASLRQGIRPRDTDPIIAKQALAVPEKSVDHISGLLIAYAVALDKKDFKQAGRYLDQAIAICSYYPGLFQGSLLLEAAYFEAHIRGHAELGRQWFSKIQDKALIDPIALLRAEAALLLAEGNWARARSKADKGLAYTQRDLSMTGSAIAENEMLQSLLQDISYPLA
jgi:hypothetical protein